MHLVNVVLFLHIAVVLIAIGVSSPLHSAEWATRHSRTTVEAQALRRVPRHIEPLFPILIVTLFGLGAWLLYLDHSAYRYRDGWVLTSILALVVLLAVGGGCWHPGRNASTPFSPLLLPVTCQHRCKRHCVTGSHGQLAMPAPDWRSRWSSTWPPSQEPPPPPSPSSPASSPEQ